MKPLLFLCAGAAGLLLGSAAPPSPQVLLPVDPAVFDDPSGCPEGAGEECILLASGGGDTVLMGLPRPAGSEGSEEVAGVPLIPPAGLAPKAPAATASPVRVVVSLPQQKAYVFRGGALIATAPVSTGRPGHPTPTGTFTILQKNVHHHSNRYSNAPMPFMQRLTNYGIALHAGALPGYPASHGCIRLPWSFAKKLYGMTDQSTRVTITHERVRVERHDTA